MNNHCYECVIAISPAMKCAHPRSIHCISTPFIFWCVVCRFAENSGVPLAGKCRVFDDCFGVISRCKSFRSYFYMMTSSNGNIFRATGHLCGEFTGQRWIPHTKASDAELWCFLWSAHWTNGWANTREAADLRRHRAHYDAIVMLWRKIRKQFALIWVLWLY